MTRKGSRFCKKCQHQSSLAAYKRRRQSDPEYDQSERERLHAQYLRHREEILANTKARRTSEEGRIKRHAYYMANRKKILAQVKERSDRLRAARNER